MLLGKTAKSWLWGTPPVYRYIKIIDLASLGRQSLEKKIVIGKVLIVGWLWVLHPYLPDKSRLARSYQWVGHALIFLCFVYISIIGLGVKSYWVKLYDERIRDLEVKQNPSCKSGVLVCCLRFADRSVRATHSNWISSGVEANPIVRLVVVPTLTSQRTRR